MLNFMSLLLHCQLFLKSLSRCYRFLIAGIYLAGFLIFGEVHPFSSYPMYNSFPNWSYTFYFTDENDSLIPSHVFDINSGDISHKFYAICEDEKINYGNGVESEEELFHIGKKMTEMILQEKSTYQYQKIQLHRRYYKYENRKVVQDNIVMYEKRF